MPPAGLAPDRMQAYCGARSNETRVESIQFAGDTPRGAPGGGRERELACSDATHRRTSDFHPSGHSLKPVDENVVEAVLSLRIDDLEPRLTRNGYDGWSADLKDELGAVLTRLACSGRVPSPRCPARRHGRLDRSLQTIRDWNTMMSKLGSIGVGAIILL
jgi:hypothetical protein